MAMLVGEGPGPHPGSWPACFGGERATWSNQWASYCKGELHWEELPARLREEVIKWNRRKLQLETVEHSARVGLVILFLGVTGAILLGVAIFKIPMAATPEMTDRAIVNALLMGVLGTMVGLWIGIRLERLNPFRERLTERL